MNRPVYLRGGEVISAAGPTLAVTAAACLQAAPPPPRIEVVTQTGISRLPYFAMPDEAEPLARVTALADQVLLQAGLDEPARAKVGLFVGTSSGLIGRHERECAEEFAAGRKPLVLRQPYFGESAEMLAQSLRINGPRQTITTACSAGANALLYAGWMIREGLLDHALVIGTEIHNRISLLGFNSLLLVAPERCRPFDRNRQGVVLGETLSVILLSHAADEKTRWQWLGGGTLCDTSHPTSPAPEKITATLRLALADAKLTTDDIVAIKAHGTGTPSNDLAEGKGIHEIFGTRVPVTSLKPALGHTLGACGVLETLAFTRCLDEGWIPATGGFTEPDPDIGLAPLAQNQAAKRGPVLLNYFGFGGNNCCLAFAPC